MHQTSRLKLDVPDGSDLVSGYPPDVSEAYGILDNAVTFTEGTISARPAAGLAGQRYYGTDTKLWYEDNGTSWGTVLVAGPWLGLTIAAGVAAWGAGEYAPTGRLEGDLVRLRGVLKNTSGGTHAAGNTWATVPSTLLAGSVLDIFATVTATAVGGLNSPAVATIFAGAISVSIAVPANGIVALDGVTYSLS